MSIPDIRPSSLDGIKRLAKILKREQQLSHARALDEAAKAAGFQNLCHAQNEFRNRLPKEGRRPLYITAYWQTEEGHRGRETIRVLTTQAWCEILKPRQLARCRELRDFRIDAVDHLETASDMQDQSFARKAVCAAARAIQFMEHTGLRPAAGRVDNFIERVHGFPGKDHACVWQDPVTGQFVLSDEPYHDAPEFVAERSQWACHRALVIRTPTWPGLYFPGYSALTLLAFEEFEVQLDAMNERLNKLPAPIVADPWRGESASYEPVFVSPAREVSGRIKRARTRAPILGEIRDNAVSYRVGIGSIAWRPAERMPISAHREASRILNSLRNDCPSLYVSEDLCQIRSELNTWLRCEYSSMELPEEAAEALYYGEYSPISLHPEEAVTRLIRLLRRHYPDCVPRRSISKKLSSIRKDVRQK